MRVTWRASGPGSPELARALRDFGYAIESQGIFSFDIRSSEPNHQPALDLLSGVGDVVLVPQKEFTKAEVRAADAVHVFGTWFWGYPQPENEYPSERTFDLTAFCRTCGVGARQVRPFIVKSQPKWGRRSFLTFFWVYNDALFARREVWEGRLKSLGIGAGPVLHTSGRVLEDLVQLETPGPAAIDTAGLAEATCDSCGRTKFVWPTASWPPELRSWSGHLSRSEQWFGPDGLAYRAIVGSPEFRDAVEGLGGLELEPLSLRRPS